LPPSFLGDYKHDAILGNPVSNILWIFPQASRVRVKHLVEEMP
jgi:hypothetical protein